MDSVDFKEFRKLNNLTQVQAASYFDCDQSFISQIERGKSKIPDSFMSKIRVDGGIDSSMFPNVITNKVENRIRYWVDVDATAGGIEMFDDTVTTNYIDISIPEFRDCTDAVNLYGDSMFPLYKPGQIIILKRWTESFIDYGNAYLIITKNGNRMVKYLRKSPELGKVLCVSENPHHDSFNINIEDINALFIVKGAIAKNTL